MHFASPLTKPSALGFHFLHWVKSGVACAGSHTAAAAESIQKIAAPAVISCGSPL